MSTLLNVSLHIDDEPVRSGEVTDAVYVVLHQDTDVDVTIFFEKETAVENIEALIASLNEIKGMAR